MVVDIVALGASASNWEKHDSSIGVNDCWKFGKPTDALLVANRPQQFIRDRFQTIINSKPTVFYSNTANWSQWFPGWKKLNMVAWYGSLHPGQQYLSETSPFIAMTLAYNLGAKDIILWGVDFRDHHLFNEGNPQTEREVNTYLQLIEALKEKGVNVWLGAQGTVFDNLIQLYVSK